MEPPNGFGALLWSLWTDGRWHRLEFRTRGEVQSFVSEYGKQCRRRSLDPDTRYPAKSFTVEVRATMQK